MKYSGSGQNNTSGLRSSNWSRVILGSLEVVGWGSTRNRVVLRCLGGVVLRSHHVVSCGNVGCSVVLQDLSEVLRLGAEKYFGAAVL